MDQHIVSPRPPTAERVLPMTLRDMDVLAGTDGHPLLVDHRRTDVDGALLPAEVARFALLDLIDPVTGEAVAA